MLICSCDFVTSFVSYRFFNLHVSNEYRLIMRHLPLLETHVSVLPLFIVVLLSVVYVLNTVLISFSGYRVGLLVNVGKLPNRLRLDLFRAFH